MARARPKKRPVALDRLVRTQRMDFLEVRSLHEPQREVDHVCAAMAATILGFPIHVEWFRAAWRDSTPKVGD